MSASDAEIADPSPAQTAVRQVFRHIMWLLFLLSMAMSLDRTNIGFAALQMNKDLGLRATEFGLAVSMLSIGFIIAGVPSNLMFARFGAKVWLPGIAVTWGLISAATASVRGAHSLYALRFLLGLAESGFLPGVILYLSYWLPETARARGLGIFLMAQPLSFLVNPLLSGPLLEMSGAGGLAGWQWLFLVESTPSIVLGVLAYFVLTDRPAKARWLSVAEKAALADTLAREEAAKPPQSKSAFRQLFNPDIVVLALTYASITASLTFYVTWAPQIIRALAPPHSSYIYSGVISGIPALATIVVMPFWSAHSDRTQERAWHTAIPLLVAAGGWLINTVAVSPALSIAGLAMALAGSFSAQPLFFSIATKRIAPGVRPAGLAAVSMIGLVANAIVPLVTGHIKDATGSFTLALAFIAAILVAGTGGVALASRSPRDPWPRREEILDGITDAGS